MSAPICMESGDGSLAWTTPAEARAEVEANAGRWAAETAEARVARERRCEGSECMDRCVYDSRAVRHCGDVLRTRDDGRLVRRLCGDCSAVIAHEDENSRWHEPSRPDGCGAVLR